MTQKGAKGGTSACPHVDMVLLSWEEIRAKKPMCDDCGKLCKGAVWLCLFQDCEFVGCGSKVVDHSSKHQDQEGHPLCINLHNKRFWCRECNGEVFEHRNRPPFLLRKFATGFEPRGGGGGGGVARSAAAAGQSRAAAVAAMETSSEVGEPEDEDDPQPESLGLTGLRNLGNTCYMNAAIQALSNCQQLTRFFIDCPELAQPGRFAATNLAVPLSTSYAGLLAELWSPQRHQMVSPHLLLQSVRQAHPAFRSWAQQDSQEFLRCFMDQLHEELKRPVLLGDEDGGGGVGGNGGDDAEGGNGESQAGNADSPPSATAVSSSTSPLSASAAGAAAASSSSSGAAAGSAAGGGEETAASGTGDSTSAGDSVGAASAGKPGTRRTHRFKSIISDTFNGNLVSTVQCSTCERLSSTLEVFQDLSLPIPSGEHLAAVQKKSASLSVTYGGQPAWWLTSLLTWPLSWVRGFLGGPRVSLQDCLAAFFSNDDLKGDNMYRCGKCGKLRNGVKFSRISRLPEMLTVHLKRFRHDFLFSSKISSYVAFPIEGLDMKPYLHRDCRARQTLYDLTAVVCHHGTTLGGHYTAFALNHAGMQWHEFDDSRVRPVDVTMVENCQAYVLFYRKRDEWMQPMRLRVKELMETREDTSSLMPFYISRPWVNKFNTFGDPGQISNADFLCPHQLLSPYVPESMAMRLPYAGWDLLMTEFGGGPTVNRLSPCPECAGELERTQEQTAQELDTFRREMQAFQRASGSMYLISMRWFRRWESYAKQRSLEPPGPIDNGGISLRRGSRPWPSNNYAQVPGRLWRYLLRIYGGGPEVRQQSTGRSESTSSTDSGSDAGGDCGAGGGEVSNDTAADGGDIGGGVGGGGKMGLDDADRD